jgi:hypothetical protein
VSLQTNKTKINTTHHMPAKFRTSKSNSNRKERGPAAQIILTILKQLIIWKQANILFLWRIASHWLRSENKKEHKQKKIVRAKEREKGELITYHGPKQGKVPPLHPVPSMTLSGTTRVAEMSSFFWVSGAR